MTVTLWMTMALQVVTTAGMHDATLERENADAIHYTLSLPDGFQPDETRPLVIALHFAGRDRRHFGRGFLSGLVEPGLRKLGAIIAAPDSPGGGWANAQGERAVLDLIDFLTTHYPIDPDRVLITGYSMGGMGTWYIAARNPERFSAAIPIAGGPRGLDAETLKAFATLPLYAIHSLSDTVVPIEPTRDAMRQLEEWDAPHAKLEEVDDVTHYNVPAFAPYLRNAAAWVASAVWR